MTTTLRGIRESADEIVAADVANGNLDIANRDSVDEYCHEIADGHHDVIYTYAVRELFSNGDLDEFLDDAYEVSTLVPAGVDGVLTVAAYYAVRSVFFDAVMALPGATAD
jgi:diacylglycerol kinase family enzyme